MLHVSFHKGITIIIRLISTEERIQDWRWREKTHASSPSTSGKTYEKTSVIQTRPEQFDVLIVKGLAVGTRKRLKLLREDVLGFQPFLKKSRYGVITIMCPNVTAASKLISLDGSELWDISSNRPGILDPPGSYQKLVEWLSREVRKIKTKRRMDSWKSRIH